MYYSYNILKYVIIPYGHYNQYYFFSIITLYWMLFTWIALLYSSSDIPYKSSSIIFELFSSRLFSWLIFSYSYKNIPVYTYFPGIRWVIRNFICSMTLFVKSRKIRHKILFYVMIICIGTIYYFKGSWFTSLY